MRPEITTRTMEWVKLATAIIALLTALIALGSTSCS